MELWDNKLEPTQSSATSKLEKKMEALRLSEKRALPGVLADVFEFACVAANGLGAYPHLGSEMLTRFPFELLGLQIKIPNTVSGSQHKRDPVWESNCAHGYLSN